MKNYKIILQYDGTKYNGWQKQGNTQNTIQSKVSSVITKMVNSSEPIEVFASGRTDAGVHALGQTANFHIDTQKTPEDILDYLNAYLPKDIAITSICEVSSRFHSRLNAKEKTYIYRIRTDKIPNVFEKSFYWHYPKKLNIEAMKSGACELIGTHDFIAFSSLKKSKKSTVRTITSIKIYEENGEIRIEYTGNGFLYNMVRIITGTLIEIGEGKRHPSDIKQILASKDRQNAGITAPPCGLALLKVEY